MASTDILSWLPARYQIWVAAHRVRRLTLLFRLLRQAPGLKLVLIAVSLGAPFPCCARQSSDVTSGTGHQRDQLHRESPTATGDTVAALDKCIVVVFQAKDKNYWFGSDGQGPSVRRQRHCPLHDCARPQRQPHSEHSGGSFGEHLRQERRRRKPIRRPRVSTARRG